MGGEIVLDEEIKGKEGDEKDEFCEFAKRGREREGERKERKRKWKWVW